MLELIALAGDYAPEVAPATIFHNFAGQQHPILLFCLQLASRAGLQDEQALLALLAIQRLINLNQTLKIPLVVNSRTIER